MKEEMSSIPTKSIPSKKLLTILGFVGLYLLTTGSSWAAFSLFNQQSAKPVTEASLKSTRSRIDPNQPKTETCPMNGQLFTKSEKDIWEARRPITAVIENHIDARPQSGLSKADIVYEAVAEGGITRFLTVYYCGASAEDVRIGPVRSVRVYFVNWATEYGKDPLFVHVGGANNICTKCPGGVKPRGDVAKEVDALRLLSNLGWRYSKGNDMDGGTNVGFPIMWRDPERIPGAATEHTFMGSTDKLIDEGIKRGFGPNGSDGSSWNKKFVPWKFENDNPASTPKASVISFEFWSNKPDYNVTWKYEKEGNRYLRVNSAKEHIDMDSKDQLSAKNVAILFVEERGPVDREGHMFYKTIGSGKVLIFQNGSVIEGTWKKISGESRTIFEDKDGKEISFVKGVIWFEAVPKGNEISYN